jgi:hypothetical protein
VVRKEKIYALFLMANTQADLDNQAKRLRYKLEHGTSQTTAAVVYANLVAVLRLSAERSAAIRAAPPVKEEEEQGDGRHAH